MGAAPALADQLYAVRGNDSFAIGSQVASQVSYSGAERLEIAKETKKATRFSADARYTRTDESGTAKVRAHFVQVMDGSGSLSDRLDDDPDSLTILNQPFAIELDPATLHDLARLHGSVPFTANSPIAGGTLHGVLRRGASGAIDGIPAIGVRFEADGKMQGGLPDHPEIAIDGSMHMEGTAYYAAKSALLVGLTARLTIVGNLRDQQTVTPVRIIYERTIRADDSTPWIQAS